MSNQINTNLQELANEGYPLTGEAREYALDENAYREQQDALELKEFEVSLKRLGSLLLNQ